MSGTLVVDLCVRERTLLTLIPADINSAPVMWVSRSPFGTLRQVEALVNDGLVRRIVIDSTGVGLAFAERVRDSWAVLSNDVRVDAINRSQSMSVDERAA